MPPLPRRRRAALVAAVACLALALPAPAPAAAVPPTAIEGSASVAAEVRQLLPAALARVEAQLGPVALPDLRIRLREGPSPGTAVSEWAAGYTWPERRLIVLRLDRIGPYPFTSLAQVLVHELSHVALAARLGPAGPVPRWFDEGVAMRIAHELGPADAWQLATNLLLGGDVELDRLDDGFHGSRDQVQASYALSLSFVSWLEDRAGPGWARAVVDRVRRGNPFAEAVAAVAGRPLDELARNWRREVVVYYRWVPILTSTVTLWLAITLLAIAAWARKRRRERARQALWEAEERAEAEAADDAGWPWSTGSGSVH